MSVDAERRFIDAYGPDDDAVRDGVAWLIGFAKANGHDRAAIFVSSLRQIDALGSALGADVAAVLRKNRAVPANGITIEIFTEKQIAVSYEGPILAVWADSKQMGKLDDTH